MRKTRVPLLYEEDPGSINDTSQLTYMVDKIKEYKYEKIGFILDRGYFCKENIQYMEKNGYAFIIMMKGKKELVSSLVLETEKLFQADKSFIGSNSMRGHTAKALSARIFVEFIALIVRNRIYNLLKETMLRLEARQNCLTVPKAIRELEKIEMVRGNNGLYWLDHAVTKKQKVILSSFGMSEDDIFKTRLKSRNC